MDLYFENLNKRFLQSMDDVLDYLGVKLSENGVRIETEVTGGGKLKITRNGNHAKFELGREQQVFRAITHLLQNADNEQFTYEESTYLENCGMMYDGSQANSILNVETCKKYMRILALMGFNTMMLYCEDTYKIEGEPHWSNMRPKYTPEDFKTLDDYAYSLGIELIPCIQVLGHLKEAMKKDGLRDICDTPAVLMVGNPKTYELIDKLIGTVAKCFRSKKIHVGMDEAFDLGLGFYLKKNGYKSNYELMREHVAKISEITKKYDLQPYMWSDMFFAHKVKTPYGAYEPDIEFTEEDRKAVPDNMNLIYWQYDFDKPEKYEPIMKLHEVLKKDYWFAAACRTGRSFGGSFYASAVNTRPAMIAVKRQHVKSAFICIWGDNNREASAFGALNQLQLFAELAYNPEVPEETVAKRFTATVGENWNDFMDFNSLDMIPELNGRNEADTKVSRFCMWQDILLGMMDYRIANIDLSDHYAKLSKKLAEHAKTSRHFASLYTNCSKVARVLSIKASLGVRLTKAYKENNRDLMEQIANKELVLLSEYVDDLRKNNRNYFFELYKPIGWEVLDIRYGGLYARCDSVRARINDFLSGKIDRLEELEEERLSHYDGPIIYGSLCGNDYAALCSASTL